LFLPFLANLFAFLRREFLQRLVTLASGAPLIRCELRPFLHTLHEPLLLGRLHRRISVRNGNPLLATHGIELLPFRLQRREHLLLARAQLSPSGLSAFLSVRIRLGCGGGERDP